MSHWLDKAQHQACFNMTCSDVTIPGRSTSLSALKRKSIVSNTNQKQNGPNTIKLLEMLKCVPAEWPYAHLNNRQHLWTISSLVYMIKRNSLISKQAKQEYIQQIIVLICNEIGQLCSQANVYNPQSAQCTGGTVIDRDRVAWVWKGVMDLFTHNVLCLSYFDWPVIVPSMYALGCGDILEANIPLAEIQAQFGEE